MDIAVTGATGLIGSALLPALRAAGHRPLALVRPGSTRVSADTAHWDPASGTIDAASLEGIGAVIHLAGAGIGDKKWTPARKRQVLESRTSGTSLIATTIAGLNHRPGILLSGSAVGIYGNRAGELLTEKSLLASDPHDFAADVCKQWELAAAPAVNAGIRTAFLRTGIVQSARGGALKKQLLLFKLGLGGRLGSGEQYVSWISIDDEVAAIVYLLTSTVSGPVNLTAPNPVTNSEYTKALGHAVKRPTLFPIPKFGPKLLLGGELANTLLFASARVSPAVLVESGFEFSHPTIVDALKAELEQ